MALWNNQRERRNALSAMAFLVPNLVGFLSFTAGPVLLSLYMSFTDWSLQDRPTEFVGFRNYADLLTDGKFWFYLFNTGYFMLGIPISIFGSLLLANALAGPMLMKKPGRRLRMAAGIGAIGVFTVGFLFISGRPDLGLLLGVLYIGAVAGIIWGSTTFRTMLYVPSFASGVATMILWSQAFNADSGLINNSLRLIYETVGAQPETINALLPKWLISDKCLLGFLPLPGHFNNGGFGLGAREAIMIMGTWMAVGGNNMILYIAAISNIPQSTFEAAEIDGAGSFAKFIHITIPSVSATTFFISVMAIIGGLQGGFQFAKIMTNGGPSGTTTTLAFYIYQKGFEQGELGYASAVSWVLFLIVFGFTLLKWKHGNRQTESA